MTTTRNTHKTAVTPAAIPAASPTPAATPPPVPPLPNQSPQAPPVTGVANGGNTGTKVEIQTSYLALIGGLMAYYQPGDEFQLPAGVMTRDQLIAQFQQFLAAAEATKTSRLVWRSDVQTERAAEMSVRPLRACLKSTLEGRFGKTGTQLTKFGFTPVKTGVRSTASKTAAVAKAKATRTARGTRGSVQKQEIVGNVTGVIITPVISGPAVPAAGSAASGSSGASAAAGTASPAATGGTPPHS